MNETHYTNREVESILNLVYKKPNDKKKRRLLDTLPINVIENTMRRHPEDRITWTTEGLLHTRSRKGLSKPQV